MKYVIPQVQADKWKPIMSTVGSVRRLRASSKNRGVLVYPEIVSDSPEYLKVMREIAQDLSDVNVTIDKSGVLGPEAVPGDFNQLLTVAGHVMNPVSIPIVDNEPIREGLGLHPRMQNERHAQIFDQLAKAMFSRARPASVPIRRDASTGPPDYVSDIVKKKTELRAALNDIDHFFNLIWEGDLLELFIEFNAPIVHTTGGRVQADKVVMQNGVATSKPREVNDELAARTALREGRRFPADKRVFVNGNEVKGHFAGRGRTIYSTAFVVNYVCAALCASWRAVYLEEYAFTWKHREPEQILEKMKKYSFFVGFDVKQFDQTVAHWMVERLCDEMENYLDEKAVKMIRLLFKAPYIVPNPWVSGTHEDATLNPLFGADPFDEASFVHKLGLPSGIAINPDVGKFMMSFDYLVMLDDYYHNVLEVGLDVILKGEHDQYALLNMGDDCLVLVNDDGFQAWAEAYIEKPSYFAKEMESPISFLGNVPYRDDAGELHLAPNVVSYLVNWLVPEQGIDHKKRMNFWAIGERERRIHYAKAPSYPLVFETFERRFRDEFGVTPTAMAADAYAHQRKFMNLSTMDALILQNPDYLHYKVDGNQISPEILDIIVTSLPVEEVWPLTRHLFNARYRMDT